MTTDAPAAEPTTARRRSRPRTSAVPPTAKRRTFHLLLVFVTLVLILNALVGDRGLTETLRARRQHRDLVSSIDRLRSENAQLRDQARRLRSDPATIEALARRELGLIRPGELLFIVKNTKSAAQR